MCKSETVTLTKQIYEQTGKYELQKVAMALDFLGLTA